MKAILLAILCLLLTMKSIVRAQVLKHAPTIVATDSSKLPVVERIATPMVRTLVGYTRRGLHLPDGHTIGVFSYSNSAPANWLFLIDARDLSSRRYAIPNNDIASHAGALGSDGNVYIMPYHTGRAYRFDVQRQTFEPIKVTGLPEGEDTWDAIGGRDGCIYFGTYPNAYLGRYEIASGKTTLWPHVADETTYVSGFAIDGDGVRFLAWGPSRVWMHIDAKSAAPTRVDPATTQAVAPTTLPSNGTEPSWNERVAGATITIGHYGSLTRRDDATRKITRGRLDNLAPGGNAIMFLDAVTENCVIGANYSQQHLFRVNPRTGAVETSEDMVARTTGQPMCAVSLNSKAYIGFYIQAILSMYDPAKPFKFNENPRELAELFTQHHQTRPSAAVTDGERVYISTEGDYSRLGGALAVIDPTTGGVTTFANIVPDQNPTTLAVDRKHRLVWGGTNRWGQMKSAPPTQPTAVIFAFDPAAGRLATTVTPWKAADVTRVLACTDDGVVVASADGEIVMIDGATAEVVCRGAWPAMPQYPMVRGRDGFFYFVASDLMYRWDARLNTLTAVAKAPGCRFLTEPSPGVWVLADLVSVYRVRL